MSTYKGKTTLVEKPVGELYERLSNLDNLREALDRIPPEQSSQLGSISVEGGALSIGTPVGNVTFEVTEAERPTKIVYGAVTSPVPLTISLHLEEKSADSTEVTPEIEMELPMMLRAMVGSKIQEAADKFGEVIALFCK